MKNGAPTKASTMPDLQLARPNHDPADDVGGQQQDRAGQAGRRQQPAVVRAGERPDDVRARRGRRSAIGPHAAVAAPVSRVIATRPVQRARAQVQPEAAGDVLAEAEQVERRARSRPPAAVRRPGTGATWTTTSGVPAGQVPTAQNR